MGNFLKSQFLTVLLSWMTTVTFISFGGAALSHSFKPFVFLYMWIPGLLALFFTKKEKISIPVFKRRENKLFFVISIAILTFVLSTFFSLPFCHIRSIESLRLLLPAFLQRLSIVNTFVSFTLLWIFSGIVISIFFYMLGILGQELMFRGYAWEKLKHLGFWKASWVIGLVWGIWMAPLMWIGMEYPGSHTFAIGMKIIYSILLCPILIYLRIISKTILASAFFYGLLLHLSNLFPFLFQTTKHFHLGMQGLTGLSALLCINLILFLKTRKTPLLEYEL